jgi:hypothetical protein
LLKTFYTGVGGWAAPSGGAFFPVLARSTGKLTITIIGRESTADQEFGSEQVFT